MKYGTFAAVLLIIALLHHVVTTVNSFKLEPGKPNTVWVQSQNGNDDKALLNIKSISANNEHLKYSVEKYAEIGIIALPDVKTIFPPFFDGRRIRDISTAPFTGGLTIIDHNKTSHMSGVIRYWKVVSKEDNNEISIGVFRYDNSTKTYQLVHSSPFRTARSGLNTFLEETPLRIKQHDILGLQTKKPVASNRVVVNELSEIVSQSGFQNRIEKNNAVEDGRGRIKGSFSFSALLETGKSEGEIRCRNKGKTVIELPQNPVYGHVSWYKFTFFPDDEVFYLMPGLISLLLNADSYIGLISENSSPWTPRAFSFTLIVLLALFFAFTARLISLESASLFQFCFTLAGILFIFGFTKYFSPSFPGFQFVAIVAAFIIIFLLPGVIVSRYYPSYGNENASGRIILAVVLSLVCWVLPALGLFLVKTSYWPVTVAALFLVILFFLKQPVWQKQKRNIVGEDLSPYWKTFQIVLWGFVVLLAVHTLFSSRFHAELLDSFHHFSLAAKYSCLPIVGDLHPNLYGVTMRTVAPYAYNLWGLLMGMVVMISGLDIGTIYCVGSSLLVLLLFIAQWWLIGLFVNSEKIRISAFAIIVVIYITRTLATFAVWFQKTEFSFITYGPSVHEFILYAVYIVLGVRAIHSKRSIDVLIFCGLSVAMAFFHVEFVLFNTLVLSLLIIFSLRENGGFRFSRMHACLLATIALLGAASFAVTSRLALGDLVDAQNTYNATFFALRYEDYPILKRFLYIFRDLLKLITTYVWHAVAIWGGLLLVIFQSKKISVRLFNTTYLIIILMFLFSYNPISEMILTPLMTSWPVKRIEIYLRGITFTFAAIILSVMISYIASFLKNNFKYANKFKYVIPALLLCITVLTYKQWVPQLHAALNTVTYNHGNHVDITYISNLPEMKFLNEYSKGKYVNILIEHPYNYTIPSLSRAYSYFHSHYPRMEGRSSYFEREIIWRKCLNADTSGISLLPQDSLLLVRNDDAVRFTTTNCVEIYKGRLFTVLKI